MRSLNLTLAAPVSGILIPLAEVPDPVFSTKTMGPGIALEPTSAFVVAPVSGILSQFHRAGHAFTVTAEDGAEVLVHVGLDTVNLRGEGFEPQARKGQRVQVGDTILRFDPELIALRAKSLVTVMVVTNAPPGTTVTILAPGKFGAGAPCVRLASAPTAKPTAATAAAESTAPGDDAAWIEGQRFVLRDPVGMHARPAAELAALARTFACRLELVKEENSADARSVTAVLGLEIGPGETLQLRARGPGAAAALRAVALLLEAAPPSVVEPPLPETLRPAASSGKLLRGICASPGLAVGTVFQLRAVEPEIAEWGSSVPAENERLDHALSTARQELISLRERLLASQNETQAFVFAAHLELLEDPALLTTAREELAEGRSADYAWKFAYSLVSSRIARLKSALLAARANDVRDVGRRVAQCLGGGLRSPTAIPDGAILISQDLTPSDIASLDPRRVRGVCTTTGGPSSHVAILARSLGLPALVAIDGAALALPNGIPVILRADQGELQRDASEEEIRQITATQEKQSARRKLERAQAQEPAITRDGKRIEVAANLKGADEAQTALELGADGVGLLRTEFLFLDRTAAPSEEEQYEAYREIAQAFGRERPLVIRTLDVGGDKPLPYLPLPKEENPFLGVRGLRVSLRNLPSFREQLRAILRAAEHGNVQVMFPMVATLGELRAAKAILEEERARLGKNKIPVGIMVEVPSVALLADHFAREADFFSIGSNDLSQYTLAIDRGHPQLAGDVDGLDPSILCLVDRAVRAAHAEKRWVGICGGIASDPQAVPILLGLGVDELSVSVPALPAVKAQIRGLRFLDCVRLAQAALAAGTAAEVRALVASLD